MSNDGQRVNDDPGVKAPFIWQNKQWQAFQRMLQADKLPHGILLSGPGETGKRYFAMALAARLLCQSPVGDQACRQCKDCLLVDSGSHPDFLILEPEAEGKSIPVDAIRVVAGFATKTAMLGGWRVMLINPTEAMTHNAANALLKTLEEPGKSTLLILIDQQQNELLATLRSRCQSFIFPVPDSTSATQWLRENVVADDYSNLLDAAGGRPLRAQRLLEDGVLEQIKLLEQMFTEVSEGYLSPVEAAEQSRSIVPIDFIDAMLAFHSKTVLNQVHQSTIPKRRAFMFTDQLLFARKLLLSKTNPNPQLLIEEVLTGWRQLGAAR